MKLIQSSTLLDIFLFLKTATLRNERKLAAIVKEIHKEHPKTSQERDTNVAKIQEEYIAQVSKEIEKRVTRKLSQEFSGTERRILGPPSKLDEFLLDPQDRVHSGSI